MDIRHHRLRQAPRRPLNRIADANEQGVDFKPARLDMLQQVLSKDAVPPSSPLGCSLPLRTAKCYE